MQQLLRQCRIRFRQNLKRSSAFRQRFDLITSACWKGSAGNQRDLWWTKRRVNARVNVALDAGRLVANMRHQEKGAASCCEIV